MAADQIGRTMAQFRDGFSAKVQPPATNETAISCAANLDRLGGLGDGGAISWRAPQHLPCQGGPADGCDGLIGGRI